jgi:hypothetical protein
VSLLRRQEADLVMPLRPSAALTESRSGAAREVGVIQLGGHAYVIRVEPVGNEESSRRVDHYRGVLTVQAGRKIEHIPEFTV